MYVHVWRYCKQAEASGVTNGVAVRFLLILYGPLDSAPLLALLLPLLLLRRHVLDL